MLMPYIQSFIKMHAKRYYLKIKAVFIVWKFYEHLEKRVAESIDKIMIQ